MVYFFKIHEDGVGDCCPSFPEYSAICEEPLDGVYVGIIMDRISKAVMVTHCPWCGENVEHLIDVVDGVDS